MVGTRAGIGHSTVSGARSYYMLLSGTGRGDTGIVISADTRRELALKLAGHLDGKPIEEAA